MRLYVGIPIGLLSVPLPKQKGKGVLRLGAHFDKLTSAGLSTGRVSGRGEEP